MKYTLSDFLGNLGVVFIILAYFGLLAERVRSDSIGYSLMNLAGGVLILISLLKTFNLSSFIIELFWIAISMYGVSRWFRRK